MAHADAKWWASRNEELYCGPYDSRDEAIQVATDDYDGEPFYVVQAEQEAIRLSRWIGADELLERAEDAVFDSDRVDSEFDDTIFDVTAAQSADLIARVVKAVDEWQDAHGLVFNANTFSWMGKPERVVPVSEEAAHA